LQAVPQAPQSGRRGYFLSQSRQAIIAGIVEEELDGHVPAHNDDPELRRPEPAGQITGGSAKIATAANSPHGLRLCGEHVANVGYTPRFW